MKSNDPLIEKLFTVSFLIAIVTSGLGFILRLSVAEGYAVLYFIAATSSLIYIVLALNEIFRSLHITRAEKIMWLTGLIILNPIAGILYVLFSRRRIINGRPITRNFPIQQT